MCCIFTCCGWMIDLVQRLWTFTMSCCISSAVCCALLTASISGIALGYNYSLAEYIDLKETNVSVYLKRGVFDDEIGDDMEFRRSGHLPVAGHIGEKNLITGEPEEDTSLRSGRRLDDSIFESDDRNKFEGSLMKLTAKAPAPTPTTEIETTIDTDKILSKYSMGSLDQMKALQSLINMKKSEDPRWKVKEVTKNPEHFVDERLPQGPIDPSGISPGRKYMRLPPMPGEKPPPDNSPRWAVPDESINERAKWLYPKLPPEAFTANEVLRDLDIRPTYPAPITIRSGPVRPTRPKPSARPRPTPTTTSTPAIGRQEPSYPKRIDEDIDTLKDKLLFDESSFNEQDFMKNIKNQKHDDDEYADVIKGVPMRKKRHIEMKTLKEPENNKSATFKTPTDKPKNLDVKDYSMYNILRNSLVDVLLKRINRGLSNSENFGDTTTYGEVLSTQDKVEDAISPEDNINKTYSRNIVLKLLKSV